MSGKVERFSARDAFTYTDTYRKASKMNAADIATERERFKERYRRGGGTDSSYYAELRGFEHAMNFVVKSEEPTVVTLGELDGTTREGTVDKEAQFLARLADVQRELSKEKSSKEKLKQDLKKVGDAYAKLNAEAVELRQLTARFRRKVAQTSSTFGVVGFAMFVVIVVLLLAMAR